MKEHRLLRRMSISSVALAIALVVNPGFAGDQKTYPGSMGVRWSGSSPTYTNSAIQNPSSSSWLYVDLPVINDDWSKNVGNSQVRVVDRHYNSNVYCSINSAGWSPSAGAFVGYWGAKKYSSGSGNALQPLPTGGIGGGSSGYHQWFSCAIPPTYSGQTSFIVSYWVDEY